MTLRAGIQPIPFRRCLAILLLAWVGLSAFACLRPPVDGASTREDLLFLDVTVVNPGEERLPHRTVSVRHGIISEIRPFRLEDAQLPLSHTLRGGFLLPGLIDIHVHFLPDAMGQNELFQALSLAHGVTAVRDMGSPDLVGLSLRERIRQGELPGPRIFSCGQILEGEPPSHPFGWVVRDEAEALQATQTLLAKGVDCFKTYDHISPEALAVVRDAANSANVPLVGHLPFALSLGKSGHSDLQHLINIPNHEEGPFASRADEFDHVVERSQAFGIAHTPTLVIWERQSLLGLGYPAAADEADVRLMPRFWREVIWNPDYELSFKRHSQAERRQVGEEFLQTLARNSDLTLRLHRAGVPIHVGTDYLNAFVVPGSAMHREMRLLADAGLTPEEVWHAATSGNADALGDTITGRIQVDAPADLLLYPEDPTTDLSRLADFTSVVADGRFYSAAMLDAILERHQSHHDAYLYDALTVAVSRLMMRFLVKGADSPEASHGSYDESKLEE